MADIYGLYGPEQSMIAQIQARRAAISM